MIKRLSLIPLFLLLVLLGACSAPAEPATLVPTVGTIDTAVSEVATPTENSPVTALPPIVLETPTTAVPTKPAATPAPRTGPAPQISISPNQGGIDNTAVQVTVKGSGFAPGASIQVNVVPEANQPGQPADGFGVGTVTAGTDGRFETNFTMPSDQPDVAQAPRLKVVAAPSDGSTGADAEFINTDAQNQTAPPALDYANPVFGFRFTIPAGWRARQPAGAIDFVGLYNPGDKSQPGAEPIVVRAMPAPPAIDGKAVNEMTLEAYARVAFPAEVGIVGQAELKSLQPLQPASGVPAYQATWHIGGSNPSDTIISYFDFNKTINSQYYRAIEVSYNPEAKHDAEYGMVVNLLSLVPVKQDAAANAARTAVQQFMDAFIAGNAQKAQALFSPGLKARSAGGTPNVPALLGIQNMPSKFEATQAASFTYATAQYAVVKGTLAFSGAPGPVQFQLIPASNGVWLIDSIIPLQ